MRDLGAGRGREEESEGALPGKHNPRTPECQPGYLLTGGDQIFRKYIRAFLYELDLEPSAFPELKGVCIRGNQPDYDCVTALPTRSLELDGEGLSASEATRDLIPSMRFRTEVPPSCSRMVSANDDMIEAPLGYF